jgi:hypothetical protein
MNLKVYSAFGFPAIERSTGETSFFFTYDVQYKTIDGWSGNKFTLSGTSTNGGEWTLTVEMNPKVSDKYLSVKKITYDENYNGSYTDPYTGYELGQKWTAHVEFSDIRLDLNPGSKASYQFSTNGDKTTIISWFESHLTKFNWEVVEKDYERDSEGRIIGTKVKTYNYDYFDRYSDETFFFTFGLYSY